MLQKATEKWLFALQSVNSPNPLRSFSEFAPLRKICDVCHRWKSQQPDHGWAIHEPPPSGFINKVITS